jgi:hypothetical protein
VEDKLCRCGRCKPAAIFVRSASCPPTAAPSSCDIYQYVFFFLFPFLPVGLVDLKGRGQSWQPPGEIATGLYTFSQIDTRWLLTAANPAASPAASSYLCPSHTPKVAHSILYLAKHLSCISSSIYYPKASISFDHEMVFDIWGQSF